MRAHVSRHRHSEADAGDAGRVRGAPSSSTQRADLILAAGVAVLALAAYLLTLSRGVLGGDAGELQFVPPILGLTHPTGYPLQVLMHYAWSLVPIGSVAKSISTVPARA